MRTIICADCGAPRETTMANTKYCTTCRLYRNLQFVRERTGKCVACNKEHALTERKAWICQECAGQTGTGRDGQCGVCGTEHANLVWPDVAVCGTCMDNPEKRGKIIAGLIQKIARNKAEYATVAE